MTDPTRVREELGGEAELRALCSAGLGIVLDTVPNHKAASDENPFWRDPERQALFFDLDRSTGHHRRFFDIGELVAVRQEDEHVFEITQRCSSSSARASSTACGSTIRAGSQTRGGT